MATPGDLSSAAALYLKALEINPNNHIASHALDALKGSRLEGASKEYVAELFDSYSASFDESLAALEYKSPFLLRKAVDGYLASEEGRELNLSSWRVLDAGCGTGLSGADFRNISCTSSALEVFYVTESGLLGHLSWRDLRVPGSGLTMM